jgi:DNA-binding NtrC family response regulator
MGAKQADSDVETAPLAPALAELVDRASVREPRVSLVVYHREGVEVVSLRPGVGVVVGRLPPADLAVDDRSLSRLHARFTLEGDAVRVEDLGSTNGTVVHGCAIESATVKLRDEVTLGAVTVVIHALPGGDPIPTGLERHDRFEALVDRELVRARFFQRTAALMIVRAGTELPVQQWLPALQSVLRPIDRGGLFSAREVELLLPEAGVDDARKVAARLLDAAKGVVLGCGVAVFPDAATSVEELVAAARAAARRADRDEPIRVAEASGRRVLAAIATAEGGGSDAPVRESPAMASAIQTARKLSRGVIPVLLQGETGSGKEVIARFIHQGGPRRDQPLVCMNCAAIPPQLVESTLFGHERGAFTGASQQQKGVFESAHGGTLLLDEVGELPLEAQAAFLRVLETKRIVRVGSTREIAVDVRIIAASHRDLEVMAAERRFRADLLYRLNAMALRVPPLRERREDIPVLAAELLAESNRVNGCAITGIHPDAMNLLLCYSWPGNVRELKNCIERAVVIAQSDRVTVDDLPERLRAVRGPAAEDEAAVPGDPDFRERVERFEVDLIVGALRQTSWNQTEAARRLQMPLRTLVHKLRAYRIRRPPSGSPD